MKRFWKWIKSRFWIRHVHQRPYTPPRNVIVVVAGDYRQFLYWCKQHQIDPRSRLMRYVPPGDAGQKLAGMGPVIRSVWFIGTWSDRNDLDEVDAYVQQCQAIYSDAIDVHYEGG